MLIFLFKGHICGHILTSSWCKKQRLFISSVVLIKESIIGEGNYVFQGLQRIVFLKI